MPVDTSETYLGDGLYVSFDGLRFRLRAPREGGDHVVFLEPFMVMDFWRYVQRTLGTAMS